MMNSRVLASLRQQVIDGFIPYWRAIPRFEGVAPRVEAEQAWEEAANRLTALVAEAISNDKGE